MQQEEIMYIDRASSSKTVDEARVELLNSLSTGGATCPCCGAKVKPYKISITANMVRELQWLVEQSGAIVGREIYPQQALFVDFSLAPPEIRKSRTVSKLRFFGLAEKKVKLDHSGEEKEVLGCWRPTTRGIKFMLNMIRIQTRCIVFRNEVISMVGEAEDAESISRRSNEIHHEP